MWIVDPKTRSGRMCIGANWVEASKLEVRGAQLYVDLPEIFSQVVSAWQAAFARKPIPG